MKDKSKVLSALVEQPSTYHVKVIDGSMLPEKMQKKKEVSFQIKPPTIQTLTQYALLLQDIPDELRDPDKNPTLQDAKPHADIIIKVIATVSWARKETYPEWYEPFLHKNLTPLDSFKMFREVAIKMQTGFFLNSFQIACQTNPMMMMSLSKDSTLTD